LTTLTPFGLWGFIFDHKVKQQQTSKGEAKPPPPKWSKSATFSKSISSTEATHVADQFPTLITLTPFGLWGLIFDHKVKQQKTNKGKAKPSPPKRSKSVTFSKPISSKEAMHVAATTTNCACRHCVSKGLVHQPATRITGCGLTDSKKTLNHTD